MDQNNETYDRDEFLADGLQFFGAITASVTHELNNVLGTIDQISGLLEDLSFTMEKEAGELSRQLNNIAGRINKQTDRGTALVKRLNGFAHSSDYVSADIDVHDVLTNLVSLMLRLARIKKVNLELSERSEAVTVNGNAFIFLHMIYLAIRRIFPHVKQDTSILFDCQGSDGKAAIQIQAAHEQTMTELPPHPFLEKICAMLNADMVETVERESYVCIFRMPLA